MDSSLETVFSLIDQFWNESNGANSKEANLKDSVEGQLKSETVVWKQAIDDRKSTRQTEQTRSSANRQKVAKPPDYDPDKYVSYIPLHNRQPGKMNISKERLAELKKDHLIDRGPWVSKEEKILQQNWDRIVKYHPEFSDPKFAFGDGHDQGGKLSEEEIKRLQKEYKKFKVIRRMAFGLNDRLICDVYFKCRRIFYNKSFRYCSRKTLPEHVEKAIRKDLKAKKPPHDISYMYDVAPLLVDTIRRTPKRRTTLDTGRFLWTPEAVDCLKSVVERQCVSADLQDLNTRDIKWKRVSKEMRSLGYQVRRKHCQYKWPHIFPNSVVPRYPVEEPKSGPADTDQDFCFG